MKIQKEIKDIKFATVDMGYDTTMEVSEPIVMASAAGWYVGKICKGEYGIEPYDRYTEYFATPEEVQKIVETPMEQGGFYEG